MRRFSSLILILITGGLFLIVQLFIIQKILERNKSEVSVTVDNQTPTSYVAVSLFVSVVNKLNVAVFLVEPSILTAIMQKRLGYRRDYNKCVFFCVKRNVTTFAGFQQLLLNKEELAKSLKNHGFMVLTTNGPDPFTMQDEFTTSNHVPYHYLLVYRDHIIHLALLYERADYLWKGPLQLPTSINQYQSHLNKNHTLASFYAAAIRKFEITEIKIDGILLNVPKRPNQFLKNIKDTTFLECNYQQAREFYKIYPKDESVTAIDFKNRAIEVIIEGRRILDEIGVPFWLSSGTCLGWFRECDIIPHSKDVDFGIWAADYKPNIISTFEMNGWMLKHILGKVDDSFELSFIHTNGLKLDLFFFYEELDHVWNGGTDVYTAIKYKYSFPKFHLCRTEFQSLLVRVPCETQSYIIANYGRHWRKKVEEWDWKSSPPNVKENGRWLEEEFQDVIQVF